MGKLIVLIGPTGAGKSVQGDLLAESLGGVHLSSGELLRNDPVIAQQLIAGKLAPAAEVERLVGDAIDAIDQNKTVILDGFPRTMSNVEWLDRELPGHNRSLVRVVVINVDLDTIMSRLKLRDRTDDAPQAISEKISAYVSRTRPVIEHYADLGLLSTIDGKGTIEEVHNSIKSVLI